MTVAVAAVLAGFLDDPAADRYGLELMERSGLPSGTLYPILTRLQRAGWAETHWEEIDPIEAGRPARRYYRLTADGVERARHALAVLHARTGSSPRTQLRPGTASRLADRFARWIPGGMPGAARAAGAPGPLGAPTGVAW
ncbi:Transcriptional regulator PadR-like family protein [Cryptosporangium aurantiacum]|uniref:Transcriptional regulator PadR-like family protein n=1 Tax=Cryptosporangium aurantiacum TaxID=134849 RepID=A0A1M7RQA9_9ACTN|nr:Transcriptional regulator PadR-like family protein [Cryptosporangium aurantiacum]